MRYVSSPATGTRTRRPVGLGWGLWVVGIALLCAAAQAVIVEDDYETGSGPYTFQIALITDPSNKYDNLRAARDTINKLVDEYGQIQMVMVLGDVTSTAEWLTRIAQAGILSETSNSALRRRLRAWLDCRATQLGRRQGPQPRR